MGSCRKTSIRAVKITVENVERDLLAAVYLVRCLVVCLLHNVLFKGPLPDFFHKQRVVKVFVVVQTRS